MTVVLPATFRPTHVTAGLPGYPAVDVFGQPGEQVRIDVTGTVRRLSGHPCSAGGQPGGAYGQSVYVKTPDGDDRFLTHFDRLQVKVGDRVTPATILGTICDSAVSHKPGTSHIHYGLHKAARPLPQPKDRRYDVFGPAGHPIVRRRSPAQLCSSLPRLVREHGAVTVRHADG